MNSLIEFQVESKLCMKLHKQIASSQYLIDSCAVNSQVRSKTNSKSQAIKNSSEKKYQNESRESILTVIKAEWWPKENEKERKKWKLLLLSLTCALIVPFGSFFPFKLFFAHLSTWLMLLVINEGRKMFVWWHANEQ